MKQPAAIAKIRSQNEFTKGVLLVLVGAFCFSTKAIFVKLCLRHGVDGLTALMFRMIFALPFYLVLPFFSRSVNARSIRSAPWIKLLLIGLVGYYLASLFDFLGLQYIQANLERLIVFVYPTLVLILGAIIFRRKITWPQTVAVGMSYAGIIIACLSQDFELAGDKVGLGIFFVFMSALTYALYLVFSDNLIKQIGAVPFTCFSMIISSLAVIVHYGYIYGIRLTGFVWQVYAYCLLMAVIATIIPTLMLTKGIAMIGSSNAAVVASFGPVATILMSYFWLQEPFSFLQGIGTVLVIGGVVFLGVRGKPQAAEELT